MNNRLSAKIFDFFITTKCTMSCRLCAAAVPYIKNPRHTPKETAFRELEEFFNVWDFAERVEFIGGEPLMHPDICEIVEETLKYRDRFDRLRVTTNATIVPSDRLLELAAGCGKLFDFIVDDYGEYSRNLVPLISKLEKYGIPCRVDVYHGDEQRFGGWIYFGDYTDQGYSDDEVKEVFNRCICPKNSFTCVNYGKAFSCVYALAFYLTKGLFPENGGYVDLLDDSISLDEKRRIAERFGTEPISACRYCFGFDTQNGRRYPGPPEQYMRGGDR